MRATPPMQDQLPELTRAEDFAVRIAEFANERPLAKRAMMAWTLGFVQRFVKQVIGRRLYIDGLDRLLALQPDRGVVLASNHRTFFDMWMAMLPLYVNKWPWGREIYFPVRSNFFYERPAGVFLNFAIGGGSLYPPIFRDRAKAAYNDLALDRLADKLQRPGVIVGIHPEGTRGKGDDPYALLPAQPGVGQIVLNARPIVIPMFVHGLTNNFTYDVGKNFTDPRAVPVIVVYDEPMDYSEFTGVKPRLALYKKFADKLHARIRELGERERELRARHAAGELDGAPGWLIG